MKHKILLALVSVIFPLVSLANPTDNPKNYYTYKMMTTQAPGIHFLQSYVEQGQFSVKPTPGTANFMISEDIRAPEHQKGKITVFLGKDLSNFCALTILQDVNFPPDLARFGCFGSYEEFHGAFRVEGNQVSVYIN